LGWGVMGLAEASSRGVPSCASTCSWLWL
jgi:hypothetical protein